MYPEISPIIDYSGNDEYASRSSSNFSSSAGVNQVVTNLKFLKLFDNSGNEIYREQIGENTNGVSPGTQNFEAFSIPPAVIIDTYEPVGSVSTQANATTSQINQVYLNNFNDAVRVSPFNFVVVGYL